MYINLHIFSALHLKPLHYLLFPLLIKMYFMPYFNDLKKESQSYILWEATLGQKLRNDTIHLNALAELCVPSHSVIFTSLGPQDCSPPDSNTPSKAFSFSWCVQICTLTQNSGISSKLFFHPTNHKDISRIKFQLHKLRRF